MNLLFRIGRLGIMLIIVLAIWAVVLKLAWVVVQLLKSLQVL